MLLFAGKQRLWETFPRREWGGAAGGKANNPGCREWGFPSQRKEKFRPPRISGEGRSRGGRWTRRAGLGLGTIGTVRQPGGGCLWSFSLFIPLSPSLSSPLHLLEKRANLHHWRNGLETVQESLKTSLIYGFVFSRLQCPPGIISSIRY